MTENFFSRVKETLEHILKLIWFLNSSKQNFFLCHKMSQNSTVLTVSYSSDCTYVRLLRLNFLLFENSSYNTYLRFHCIKIATFVDRRYPFDNPYRYKPKQSHFAKCSCHDSFGTSHFLLDICFSKFAKL